MSFRYSSIRNQLNLTNGFIKIWLNIKKDFVLLLNIFHNYIYFNSVMQSLRILYISLITFYVKSFLQRCSAPVFRHFTTLLPGPFVLLPPLWCPTGPRFLLPGSRVPEMSWRPEGRCQKELEGQYREFLHSPVTFLAH